MMGRTTSCQGKLFASLLVACVIVLGFWPHPALGDAQVAGGGSGVFLNLSFSPGAPKLLEKMNIYATVAGGKNVSLLLEVAVVENGNTNVYRNYSFSLTGNSSQTFSFDYTPADVGRQSIVANLYSADRSTIYGSDNLYFQAESDIGPFRVNINLPTDFVPAGESLPVTLDADNLGSRGMDTNLSVTISCFDGRKMAQDLPAHMNASGSYESSFAMQTCNEPGMHNIVASLSAAGNLYASQTSQYIERTDLTHLNFLIPAVIAVTENGSSTLNIIYHNANNQSVTNVRPIVFGVPSPWLTITPQLIPEIRGGGSAAAVVRIAPPAGSGGDYSMLLGAGGDNLYDAKPVKLVVSGMLSAPLALSNRQLATILIIIGAAAVVIAVTVFLIRIELAWKAMKERYRRVKGAAIGMMFLSLVLMGGWASGQGLQLTGEQIKIAGAGGGGVFLNVSLSPPAPKLLEKMAVNTVVASDKSASFFLEVLVSEGGKTNVYKSYNFSLDARTSRTFPFDYVPTDAGVQYVTANLYSADESVIYGSDRHSFQAESGTGPFDFQIGLPTNFVSPGYDLPVLVSVENFGSTEADANLTVGVSCFGGRLLQQAPQIRLNASGTLDKYLVIPTCGEPGAHTLVASLGVYGRTYASHSSQYFERQGLARVHFVLPAVVSVAENGSAGLSVVYHNANNVSLGNVAPVVFGIPQSWYTATPSLVPEIPAGGSAAATIDFSAPAGSAGEYPIIIGASGDNVYDAGQTRLIVTGTLTGPTNLSADQIATILFIMASAAVVIGVALYVIRSESKESEGKEEKALERAESMIEKGQTIPGAAPKKAGREAKGAGSESYLREKIKNEIKRRVREKLRRRGF